MSANRSRTWAMLTAVVVALTGFVSAPEAQAVTPVATSLSVTTAAPNGGITTVITGKSLTGITAVRFGETRTTKVKLLSSTRLQVTVPRHSVGTVKLTLLAGSHSYATGLTFRYVALRRQPSTVEAKVFALVNAARAKARVCGRKRMPAVKPLTWSPLLAGSAWAHSSDMAARNYFSHTSADGTPFFTRISQTGYGWRMLGENIAAGQPDAAAVMAAWLKSPGHCENIMTAGYTQLGIGQASGGSYGTYWTQDFGKPS